MVKKFLSILLLSIFASIFIIPNEYAASNEDFNTLYNKEIDNLIIWINEKIENQSPAYVTQETHTRNKDNIECTEEEYLSAYMIGNKPTITITNVEIKFINLDKVITYTQKKSENGDIDEYISLTTYHLSLYNNTKSDSLYYSHTVFIESPMTTKFNELKEKIKSAQKYLESKNPIEITRLLNNEQLEEIKEFME